MTTTDTVQARGAILTGIEARMVNVTARFAPDPFPGGFDVLGLSEQVVRESRVRVRAALHNSGFTLTRAVVVNLTPAEPPARAATVDLPIAVALLAAHGACSTDPLASTLLFGELSLSGELRPGRGLIPALRAAIAAGLARAIVPHPQIDEAAIVAGIEVHGARDLPAVVEWLTGERTLSRPATPSTFLPSASAADLSEIQGQSAARRALEIAAAGAHHILLVGAPGSGKTMLARRLAGILPPLSADDALVLATIASAAGHYPAGRAAATVRPFRAPHHTASAEGIFGGGLALYPGEVTLAHGGVLLLDELPEFKRSILEQLGRITRDGQVRVGRSATAMPAGALVVGAMNPCPCGWDGDTARACSCEKPRIAAYHERIVSTGILDRFDLRVRLPPVTLTPPPQAPTGETSATVRARVMAAREVPRAADGLTSLAALSRSARAALHEAADGRRDATRRVAYTIAALAGRQLPTADDVTEAREVCQ